jgi:methyltransferase family protein
MNNRFAVYRAVGHRFVNGWLEPEVLDITHTLDSVQHDHDVSGAVAEIGVHSGRLFIGLHLLHRGNQRSLAIDLFSQQHLNLDDPYGGGERAKFLANVGRWASTDGLIIHEGDSTKVDAATVLKLTESPVRLFSIDGGHIEHIVLSDMNLAEATLADGGIVIADDVFNYMWPGVAVGTLSYLQNSGTLAPFAIGFNKVFFTQPDYVKLYRDALESKYNRTMRISVHQSVYAGHDVSVLYRTPRTPRRLLRKNPTARTLYQSLVKSGS